jgi:serine/threonine-protein kinase PpkA
MVKIKTINNGGFGVVSLYENNGILYAVKELINKWDPRNWKMFTREIDLMKTLKHPNIVSIRGYDKDQNNPYYVMDYYPEGSLRDKLNQLRKENRLLDEKSACAIILVISRALLYAHSNGAIHRDLKPENILFKNNNPIIADWGIGKFIHKQSKVYTYKCGGTPAYCAPEQWNYGQSDHRSDIFSLGIMFRELLTGRVDGEIKNYRLKKIIDKMTAFHPDYRYQSMREVSNELENLHTFSENPMDDFWEGLGKALLIIGGLALVVGIFAAILDD